MNEKEARAVIARHINNERAVALGTAYVIEMTRQDAINRVARAVECLGGQILDQWTTEQGTGGAFRTKRTLHGLLVILPD